METRASLSRNVWVLLNDKNKKPRYYPAQVLDWFSLRSANYGRCEITIKGTGSRYVAQYRIRLKKPKELHRL